MSHIHMAQSLIHFSKGNVKPHHIRFNVFYGLMSQKEQKGLYECVVRSATHLSFPRWDFDFSVDLPSSATGLPTCKCNHQLNDGFAMATHRLSGSQTLCQGSFP